MENIFCNNDLDAAWTVSCDDVRYGIGCVTHIIPLLFALILYDSFGIVAMVWGNVIWNFFRFLKKLAEDSSSPSSSLEKLLPNTADPNQYYSFDEIVNRFSVDTPLSLTLALNADSTLRCQVCELYQILTLAKPLMSEPVPKDSSDSQSRVLTSIIHTSNDITYDLCSYRLTLPPWVPSLKLFEAINVTQPPCALKLMINEIYQKNDIKNDIIEINYNISDDDINILYRGSLDTTPYISIRILLGILLYGSEYIFNKKNDHIESINCDLYTLLILPHGENLKGLITIIIRCSSAISTNIETLAIRTLFNPGSIPNESNGCERVWDYMHEQHSSSVGGIPCFKDMLNVISHLSVLESALPCIYICLLSIKYKLNLNNYNNIDLVDSLICLVDRIMIWIPIKQPTSDIGIQINSLCLTVLRWICRIFKFWTSELFQNTSLLLGRVIRCCKNLPRGSTAATWLLSVCGDCLVSVLPCLDFKLFLEESQNPPPLLEFYESDLDRISGDYIKELVISSKPLPSICTEPAFYCQESTTTKTNDNKWRLVCKISIPLDASHNPCIKNKQLPLGRLRISGVVDETVERCLDLDDPPTF
eukprot:GHVL01039774.1.p1 GENE.GHVL01039774.1~~GHVL01039774.1.p1  ORF type:complete len:646 (+),score=145.41 GHVL01039774.1:169-1938(+)